MMELFRLCFIVLLRLRLIDIVFYRMQQAINHECFCNFVPVIEKNRNVGLICATYFYSKKFRSEEKP